MYTLTTWSYDVVPPSSSGISSSTSSSSSSQSSSSSSLSSSSSSVSSSSSSTSSSSSSVSSSSSSVSSSSVAMGYCEECLGATPRFWAIEVTGITGCTAPVGEKTTLSDGMSCKWQSLYNFPTFPYFELTVWSAGPSANYLEVLVACGGGVGSYVNFSINLGSADACAYSGLVPVSAWGGSCNGAAATCTVTPHF